MKKGLFTFLKISVACLIVIAIIALASHYFTTDHFDNDKTTSANNAEYSSDAPHNSNSSPVSGDALSKSPENGSDSSTSDTTSSPSDKQGAEATNNSDSTDSENEPVLPEATPEPDMDPDTWDYIKGGDYNMVYNDKEIPEVMPYEIHVNKQMNCITVYEPNKKGKYTKAVKSFVCSAGRDTPLGTFKTSDKYYWKAMIHDVWAQYATRITGKILFHSVPYETHEKDTLVTSYYNQLGSTASAGCVRLAAADAQWITENCPAGTTVVIYNSPDSGPLGKPSPIRIPYNCTWDPTDPDTRNPWNSKETNIAGVKNRTIERGANPNYLQGVIAYDIFNKKMSSDSIKVSSKLDKSKPGDYKVTYSFTDSKGNKVKEKAVFTVADTTAPKITGLPTTYYTKDASSITEESLLNRITLTDNGYSLDKASHLTLSLSGNSVLVNAHDDFGHNTSLSCKIIEDNKAPEIKLDKAINDKVPVTKKIDSKWAAKRIKKVTDNVDKLTAKDVKIKLAPSGWGIKITYSLTDKAGNKVSTSETIQFETASISFSNPYPIVNNIKDIGELESFMSLKSDITGKKVDYKLKVSRQKLEGNEQYKTYNVTYTATYKSSAGTNKAVNSIIVSVPR